MINIYLNQKLTDVDYRRNIFEGSILIYSGIEACVALCNHAWQILQESFDTENPELVFQKISVEEFVKRAEITKNKFTNGLRSKELLQDYVREMGFNPNEYYFDVPRIRIVPNYNYLHAGVSYAYAAHRDTWYGGPSYQINHWMPVRAITPDQAMALYPTYFRTPINNSSKDFDLSKWINLERKEAVNNIQKENRLHPLPLERFDRMNEIRFAGSVGNIIVFSGVHLHATVPNHTQITRFSIDFRLFHMEDVCSNGNLKYPENIDCEAHSEDYGMSSCFNLGDFSPFKKQA